MVRVGSRLFFSAAAVIALAASSAAGFEVSNLADAGAGSLRQAVLDANGSPGPDLVTFQPNLDLRRLCST